MTTAVIDNGGLDGRQLRILNQRQRPVRVPRASVDRDALAIDAETRSVGSKMRQQRRKVLREALFTQICQDRDETLRCSDLSPRLVEGVAALHARCEVGEDQRRKALASGIRRPVDVHLQRPIGLVLQRLDRRCRRRRIEELHLLRGCSGGKQQNESGGEGMSRHAAFWYAARVISITKC